MTGPDWSASQVIQPVDLSALLHWLGVVVVIGSIFINCMLSGGICGIVSGGGVIIGCSGSSLAHHHHHH